MALKAREINKRDVMNPKKLIAIFVALIIFQVGYGIITENLDQSTQAIVSAIGVAISLGITMFILRKMLPRYEMIVADNNLVIYKAMFFKPRMVITVPVGDIVEIKPLFEKQDLKGRKVDYTLVGVRNKIKYAVEWDKNGKKVQILIQASKKFVEKLEKEVTKNK
ncbi:hypothetical protein [Alkalibacter saccharofermentans]|uniref:Uncharacterized protein n=1 Tax=Alkalibacter saccharofermentans DSM 14828 TaxID=1120975 RepID=A0A1M4TA17_9FIRM|nr:hypothetical protein [Alkalibacter saccharofermentans]SHE41087.1 hypothetical protein SAMN02746064_00424 [Alkalibacter saccharofermentans DSM 14828]